MICGPLGRKYVPKVDAAWMMSSAPGGAGFGTGRGEVTMAVVQASAGELAEQALDLIDTDPARARRAADQALRLALDGQDRASLVAAHRAVGAVAAAQQDLATAVGSLRTAIRIALRAGLPQEAGRARLDLARALSDGNDNRGALRALAAAQAQLTEPFDLARVAGQRARVLYYQGRLPSALTAHTEVLAEFRRLGDRSRESVILHNRALVHTELGRLAAAQADLERSEQICLELGEERAAVDAQVHLGWVLARRGDLPGALACFERADRWLVAHDDSDPDGLIDRCDVLLAARLLPEARAAARAAESGLAERGAEHNLAMARLRRSEAALLDGDLVEAREAAEGVRRVLAGRNQPALAALARYALLRVDRAEGPPGPELLRRARSTAAALAANGWALPAADARLIAADLAITLGRPEQARQELTRIAATRRQGPVQLRARAWHAEALTRLAGGDRAGAEAALRSGFAMLARYRSALGATELRAASSQYGVELARLGLGLAVQDAAPARVFRWAERHRASALAMRPVRPPEDGALATDLEALRAVAGRLDTALAEGQDTTRLRARQARLEDAVRRRTRLAAGERSAAGQGRTETGATVSALRAVLGTRVLAELVEHDGRLYAVLVGGARPPVLHRLGELAGVLTELAALRYALRRRASGHGSARALAANDQVLAATADRLDQLLLEPILTGRGPAGSAAGVVVVPTGPLHAVPWGLLPSLQGRELSVAPSAAVWLRAHAVTQQQHRPGVVLVAGPDLPEAAQEVADLAGSYPAAQALTGERATVSAVLAALEGAGVAHLASHGRFRADNPLFSALQLADGPLTVYDLEGLRAVPAGIVLSACDAGLSDVRPGDELMGMAAALLALGAGTVISAVAPVPDDATRRLMAALHAELRAGSAPASALARAQLQRREAGDPAAADAFVCFGAG